MHLKMTETAAPGILLVKSAMFAAREAV